MMRFLVLRFGTLLSIAAAVPGIVRATTIYSYTTINLPAGYDPPNSINDSGQMAGTYSSGFGVNSTYGGYIRNADGSLNTWSNNAQDFHLYGLNNSGQAAGYIDNCGSAACGILTNWPTPGSYGYFNVPPSAPTYAQGVNDQGDEVGYYQTAGGGANGFIHQSPTPGQIGHITTFTEGTPDTYPEAINNSREAAGWVTGSDGHAHGFFANINSLLSAGILPPDLVDAPGATDTYFLGLNNAGAVVGDYDTGSPASARGFLLTYEGTFPNVAAVYTDIFYPGALFTIAYGINDEGDIVGLYADSQDVFHAFLATPSLDTSSAVPEPATYTVGLGLGLLLAFCRRARRQNRKMPGPGNRQSPQRTN